MKELKEIFDDYLTTVLTIMGVPDISFEYADPSAIFMVFIFSTEIFTFILAVILWGSVAFFKTSDKWGIKEQQGKSEEHEIHSYDASDMREMSRKHKMGNMNEMGDMHKMKQERGFFSIFVSKFLFPVVVIFIALSFVMRVAGLS